ncbi:MAG: hypothetical protein IJJ15_09805 [Ruminococcus sp.]|nr:hypothetical protein [Ruminococcus sp.]
MAKKNIEPEVFSPEQLEQLENKGDRDVQLQRQKESIFDRYSARRDSKDLAKEVRWKRRAGVALIVAVLVLLLLWLISWLLTTVGDLVIEVENTAAKKGITISENIDGSDPTLKLSAAAVEEVTNITYDWLPLTELDADGVQGQHNGKNYLAYTFYLTNNGSETLDYNSQLILTGVAKSADEALRVMIYKNGEATVYGKHNMDDSPLEDIVNFEFVDDKIVCNTSSEGLKPGDVDKYTIVTWIEGNDPECIDEIMGGFVKMQWLFSVDGEQL